MTFLVDLIGIGSESRTEAIEADRSAVASYCESKDRGSLRIDEDRPCNSAGRMAST
jgi:hypothetical protein